MNNNGRLFINKNTYKNLRPHMKGWSTMMNKLFETTVNIVKGYDYDYKLLECRNAAIDYLRVTIGTFDTSVIIKKPSINSTAVVSFAYEIVNGLRLFEDPECFTGYLSHIPLLSKEANLLCLSIIEILKAETSMS